MIIGIISDTHLGLARDPFREEVKKNYDKAMEILKDCDIIIHAGDIFDRNNIEVPYLVSFLKPIKEFELKIFYILGNHDIMRSNLIPVIDRYIEIKGEEKYFLSKADSRGIRKYKNEEVNIIGIDYDEDPRSKIELVTKEIDPNKYNILVIHQDILNYSEASYNPIDPKYLSNLGFDRVISGHIHKSDLVGNLLITGSTATTRFNKLELEAKKYIYKLDTEKDELKSIEIPEQTTGIYIRIDGVGKAENEIKDMIKDVIDKNNNKFINIELMIDKHIALNPPNNNVRINKILATKLSNQTISELNINKLKEMIKKDWNYSYSYEYLENLLNSYNFEDEEEIEQFIKKLNEVK